MSIQRWLKGKRREREQEMGKRGMDAGNREKTGNGKKRRINQVFVCECTHENIHVYTTI